MVKLESANQQIGSGTTMHEGTLMYEMIPRWLVHIVLPLRLKIRHRLFACR
jgi:hypothetical protein